MMDIGEDTCDGHWVWCVGDELLYSTPKASVTLHVDKTELK